MRRKDWKPSAVLEKAYQHVPSNLTLLSVTEVSENLSSMLASLPGTLQTMINTSIALAKGRAGGTDAGTNAAPGMARRPGGPMMGPGRAMSGIMRSGGQGGGRPGFGPQPNSGSNPPAGSAGNAGNGTTGDSMIVIKVDADKLPSASDLKTHLFPATVSVTVSDPEIRVVTRGAFPDISLPVSLASAGAMMPFVKPLIDRLPQTPVGGSAGAQAGATAATPPAAAEPRAAALEEAEWAAAAAAGGDNDRPFV